MQVSFFTGLDFLIAFLALHKNCPPLFWCFAKVIRTVNGKAGIRPSTEGWKPAFDELL
jgi:hypothetical protein